MKKARRAKDHFASAPKLGGGKVKAPTRSTVASTARPPASSITSTPSHKPNEQQEVYLHKLDCPTVIDMRSATVAGPIKITIRLPKGKRMFVLDDRVDNEIILSEAAP